MQEFFQKTPTFFDVEIFRLLFNIFVQYAHIPFMDPIFTRFWDFIPPDGKLYTFC